MTQPITSPPPVNNVITIQPIITAAPERDSSGTPNAFSNLPAGTTVEGFVVNRDGSGNPILRTPVGDVLVQSDVFLKTGSEVVIRIDPTVATRARIVTVDGQTPQDYSATTTAARGLQQDTITPSPLQLGTPAAAIANLLKSTGLPSALPLLQARVLQATNTSPKSPASQSSSLTPLPPSIGADRVPPALAQLPPGTPLQLTVLDVELPPVPISLASLPDVELPANLLPPAPQTATPATSSLSQPSAPQSQTSAQSSPLNQATTPAPFATPSPQASPITSAEAFLSAQQVSVQPQSFAAPAPLSPNTPSPTQPQSNYPAPLVPVAAEPALLTPVRDTLSAPAPVSVANVTPASAAATTAVASTPATSPTAISSSPLAAAITGNAPPASTTTTNILHAHVLGHEADGANIVQTKFATLKIYTPQPLPTGTNLTLHVELLPQATVSTETLGKNADTLTNLTRDWQNLGDALNQLQATDPAAARAALNNIPTVSHRLASSVLFFLSAIKGGDVKELLGARGVNKIGSMAPELLARLTQDVGQMQQFYVDSPLNQWNGVMLPMLFGQELQQARLYIRRDGAEEKSATPITERGQRFILEVDMSQLGDMQFDGFVRGANTKAFDLIIRTARPLPDEVSQHIRGLFDNAAEVTGLKGQLAFQQGVEHFVRPLASVMNANSGPDTHTILA